MRLIADIPFQFLPHRTQYFFVRGFALLASEIEKEMGDNPSQSQIGLQLARLQSILKERPFKVSDFCAVLKDILALASAVKSWRYEKALLMVENIIGRDRELELADQAARQKAAALPPEQILRRDKETIVQIQFYALDYFLFVYKKLKESPQDKKIEVLREKAGDMPSLLDDIMSEDMLKKMACMVIDQERRYAMAKDFYRLKSSILPVRYGKTDNDTATGIEAALKAYCRKLLAISREYGLESLSHGFHFPYGEGADCAEVMDKL